VLDGRKRGRGAGAVEPEAPQDGELRDGEAGRAHARLVPEPVAEPAPPRRVVEVAPGAAEGSDAAIAGRASGGTTRRTRVAAPRRTATATPAANARAPRSAARSSHGQSSRPAAPGGPSRSEPVYLSADGLARLRAEHAELTERRRPEVVARIKAAKELGDLKENADYTAAREEQSFLEGRIATIEALLRDARVIEAPSGAAGGRIDLGSKVSVEGADEPGDVIRYEIVGTAEADPGAGRLSNASPVGRALIGRFVGDTVSVATPRGEVRYRIVAVE
jgi:transcription elongation factor GreA